MNAIQTWWNNDLSRWVKFAFLVLLANAVPAFTILMLLPHMTETLFVWTINPVINARLIGVMYSNAMLLVLFGALQKNWLNVRITMVVITLFSILATLLTFVYIKPFLAHPWFHLAYWLGMYFILFFASPYVFVTHERKYGGRPPTQIPLNMPTRLVAGIAAVITLICGLGLLLRIDLVNQIWPWTLPPLVGGLIGVLCITHTAAYAWALWDGDWIRVRPMFWQGPPSGLLFILLPLLHAGDLRADAGNGMILYYAIAGFIMLATLGVILSYRSAEQQYAAQGQ